MRPFLRLLYGTAQCRLTGPSIRTSQSPAFVLSFCVQVQFCKRVINEAGVAFVPGRIFFNPDNNEALASPRKHKPTFSNGDVHKLSIPSHQRYVRIAFCKKDETLMQAQSLVRRLDKMGE